MLTQWTKTKSLYFREQLMPSEEKNEFLAWHFSHIGSRGDFTHAEQHLDLVGNGWTGSNLMDPKRTSAKAFCMRLATQMLRVMKKKHTSCIQLRRDCADNALSVDHKTWPAVVIMAHEIGLPFLRPLPSLGGNHCFFEQFDAIRIAAYQHSPMDLPNIPDPFVLLRLVSPFCHFLSNHLTDGRWGGRIDDQVNGHSLGHVIHMQTTGLTAPPHFFSKAIQQRLNNLRYHLQNCYRPLHLNLNHLHPHLLAWEPIGCLLEQICLLPLAKVDVSHSVASAASRDLHQNVLEELSGLRVLMEENLHLSRLRLHLQGMQTLVQIPCASFCCCGSGWWRRSPFAHGWHCPPLCHEWKGHKPRQHCKHIWERLFLSASSHNPQKQQTWYETPLGRSYPQMITAAKKKKNFHCMVKH